jgi:Flp pilus assembly protein TadD
VVRAEQRLKEGDYAEAARALRRARGLPGDDGLVGRNLAVVLTEWARALALAGQCAEAKARLAEAQQLGARKIVLPGSCGS